MNTNFYLKAPKSEADQLVYLVVHFSDQRFKYSTSQKIAPKHWNSSSQRVKRSYDGYSAFNEYLDSLEAAITTIYRKVLAAGENPTIKVLKEKLDIHLKKAETKRPKQFIECFQEYIEVKKSQVQYRTWQKTKTLLTNFQKMSKQMKYPLTFENANIVMYEKYKQFRVEQNISNETISREIVMMKEFLMFCVDRGYYFNTDFVRQWKTFYRDKKVLALTLEELFILYNHETRDEMERLVLDIFLFSAFSSLRWSDVLQVNQSKVIGTTLTIHQVKMKSENIIHLNKFALEVLHRNGYNFNKMVGKRSLSNAYANVVLKRVAADAKLERWVIDEHYSGPTLTATPVQVQNVISMHWGRRSYISISLSRGMRHESVMQQSNHKKLETLQKYIAVSREMVQKESNQAWDNMVPNSSKEV